MAMACSRKLLFFLSAILILIAPQAIAQSTNIPYSCSDEKGNYTANSTYATNLYQILLSLTSNTELDYGFYNSSYGQNSDQVYAIGLCRGDVQPNLCRSCLNNSTITLKQLCPNQKEAIVWYDDCMLRYSNSSIFGIMETSPPYFSSETQKVSANDVNQFNQNLSTLLEGLRSQAAAGGSLKFATGNAFFNVFQAVYIYAQVQCTPDLSENECDDCLAWAIGNIPNCCAGKEGGRVLVPSCNLRFEINYPLYETTAYASPSTNTTKGKGNNTSGTVIIIVVPTVVFVVFIVSIYIYFRVRKPKKKVERVSLFSGEAVDEIRSAESLQFDFDTIRMATEDFSDANKLGQGGFGAVYKGMLSDGQVIAVKRMSRNSRQGDLEFKNEVLLVVKLQHRNLVRLLGFCLEGNERLLVYEFVPNTSLDHFLFDPTKRAHLDWERRYKIIGGIVRGLLYLHEDSRLRIIHRDLKASNVLLDAEMNSKISDFGMARLFALDESEGNTNKIVGTYGYMAPEYAMHGQFSVKSDVFSFGVLVLEIVSGQKSSCFRNGENVEDLLSYAWKNWREGTSLNLIDPTLKTSSTTDIMRCIHIGLLCVQESAADRPTMASVVLMLNSYSITLPIPSQPGFFMRSNIESDVLLQWKQNVGVTGSYQSKSSSFKASTNDASITELYPR